MDKFGKILESFGLEVIVPNEVIERLSEEEILEHAGQNSNQYWSQYFSK
jgi:hypothetical protein